MNFPGPGNPPQQPKKEVQLQGPRPPPLKVNKDSHKIKKPPPHPPPKQPPKPSRAQEQPQQQQQQQPQNPVIIYAVSPKVVHATTSDFMSIVQRLTGLSSSTSPSGAGDLSPAARFASIEKTSPSERDRERDRTSGAALMYILEGDGVLEMGQTHPGILSPAPATLPPIPEGYFPPVNEPQNFPFLHELSPAWHNGFSASPSGLLSAPLYSPSPSSLDFLQEFFDL